MSDRTVPERINEFLVRCAGRAYCDHCIQERLGLRWRQQVQLVTATLGVTSGFRRSTAVCCTCQDTKQVTSYIAQGPSPRATVTLSLPKQPSARPGQALGVDEFPLERGRGNDMRLGGQVARRAARGPET